MMFDDYEGEFYEPNKHEYNYKSKKWTTSNDFNKGLNRLNYKLKWTRSEFDKDEEPEEYNQYCLDILNNDDEVVINCLFVFWNDYNGDGRYHLEIEGFNAKCMTNDYLILDANNPNDAIKECNEILKNFVVGLGTIDFN